MDGKVCRGTQTIESNFPKEKPIAVVKPNNHLRDVGVVAVRLGGARLFGLNHPQQ